MLVALISLLSVASSIGVSSHIPYHCFSDNSELNSLISEVYAYNVPKNYTPTRVTICFGLKTKSSNKYYNYVRIGNERGGKSAYIEVLSFQYDSYEEAIKAVDKYTGFIETNQGIIKCDFSKLPHGFRKSYVCNIYDVTDLNHSPQIKEYLKKNKLLVESKIVKAEAVRDAINGKNAFQCVDQFSDISNVKVFLNGNLVDHEKYKIYKQGKVQFYDSLTAEGDIVFEYNRNIRRFKSFSNDLSKDISMFLDVHSGCDGKMYSFVPDPLDKDRDVLMINCQRLLKEAANARQQFSDKTHKLTYFKDRIKLLLPIDMKDAMISYPQKITWFSLQGSWCQFGSQTGQTENMYSGCGNSFGICKPTTDSKELFFHLYCRLRHCETTDGSEKYEVLTEEISDFPVKAGEWITIEREWKVGNPGICKHTIIDSDGKHEFFVNAYNCVCDPENESLRYGDKYAGDNPYNFCHPFICKLYTSKSLAQYCIERIGGCYLYYKDYEFIEGENVNAFN